MSAGLIEAYLGWLRENGVTMSSKITLVHNALLESPGQAQQGDGLGLVATVPIQVCRGSHDTESQSISSTLYV